MSRADCFKSLMLKPGTGTKTRIEQSSSARHQSPEKVLDQLPTGEGHVHHVPHVLHDSQGHRRGHVTLAGKIRVAQQTGHVVDWRGDLEGPQDEEEREGGERGLEHPVGVVLLAVVARLPARGRLRPGFGDR